jgi:general secretion pathway protein D
LDASGKVVVGYPGLFSIDAIKRNTHLKIRSNPSLIAQNNKEASVNIVNQIPILKSTVQGGAGTSRDIIQNIDRMDVGIKLKLTPSIIPGGQVRMVLNPSIEAVIDPGPSGSYAPTIARRDVTTTVTVPDGETIVIAGLTREDQSKIVQKIPILGSIPIIGFLFRHTVDGTEKTNVLIFVTPRIAVDTASAHAIADDLQKRTGLNAHEQR